MSHPELSDAVRAGGALLLPGAATAAVVMAVLWAVARRLRNYGLVDVGWTWLVAGLALLFSAAESGDPLRRVTIGTMYALWGIRLGTYLLRDRVLGRPEDGRYASLRGDWSRGPGGGPAAADRRFFWFFQAQGLAALLFALPALPPALNAAPALTALETAAVGLWTVAVVGESFADRQLAHFKRQPRSRGRTCRIGLWRYSRHPNYFFEWLVWVAYALFALASPFGVVALACPLVMLYLLFRVTGIPATEAQGLRSRGDDYRRYQETTSAFVPWWPARSPAARKADLS